MSEKTSNPSSPYRRDNYTEDDAEHRESASESGTKDSNTYSRSAAWILQVDVQLLRSNEYSISDINRYSSAMDSSEIKPDDQLRDVFEQKLNAYIGMVRRRRSACPETEVDEANLTFALNTGKRRKGGGNMGDPDIMKRVVDIIRNPGEFNNPHK